MITAIIIRAFFGLHIFKTSFWKLVESINLFDPDENKKRKFGNHPICGFFFNKICEIFRRKSDRLKIYPEYFITKLWKHT